MQVFRGWVLVLVGMWAGPALAQDVTVEELLRIPG